MTDTEAALWAPPVSDKDRAPKARDALRAVPLFEDLKDAELKKILRLLHERVYQPGEIVFRRWWARRRHRRSPCSARG